MSSAFIPRATLCTLLLLACGACSSALRNELPEGERALRNELADARERLLKAREVAVIVNGEFGETYLVARLSEALSTCAPAATFQSKHKSPLTIYWTDDRAGRICIDYDGPECYTRVVIVQVSDGNYIDTWASAAPNSCADHECLADMFFRDLKEAVCK